MLGIYIHWPFCVRKCQYCAFASVPDLSGMDAYERALLIEIEKRAMQNPTEVDTAFFGGGTPSVAPAATIPRILDALRSQYTFTSDCEISIEANPSSVTAEKLQAWREAGATRLSMGLQAAQDACLERLGRLHNVRGFECAYHLARSSGFRNINVDLIYGLPWQTMLEWDRSLSYVLSLEPEHISGYCLALEEGTPLYASVASGKMPGPDEDLQADMYERMHYVLEKAGYIHYEVSNFAREGRECKHNLRYWTLGDYLGLGCAAHSLLGDTRYANLDSVPDYVRGMQETGTAQTCCKKAGALEREEEYLMLFTRLKQGFSIADFENRFQKSFRKAHGVGLEKAEQEGLIEVAGDRVTPTLRGFEFQNRLALHLIGD